MELQASAEPGVVELLSHQVPASTKFPDCVDVSSKSPMREPVDALKFRTSPVANEWTTVVPAAAYPVKPPTYEPFPFTFPVA